MLVYGLLALSEGIYCTRDVLGEVFEVEISGIKAQIHFPVCAPAVSEENTNREELLPPRIAVHWKVNNNLSWGFMWRQSGSNCIECLAIQFECEDSSVPQYTKLLYECIEKWEHSFIDYLILETKQHTQRNKNNHRKGCYLELKIDDTIYRSDMDMVYASVLNNSIFATKSKIREALAFAGSGKALFPEYQMMLSAYEARRGNKNRPAIIDACAALEICLLKYLRKRCKEFDFDSEWLLENKFRSLGDRVRLAENIDSLFPVDGCDKKVVKPRNDIAHNRNVHIDDQTADTLIACVETILSHYLTEKY